MTAALAMFIIMACGQPEMGIGEIDGHRFKFQVEGVELKKNGRARVSIPPQPKMPLILGLIDRMDSEGKRPIVVKRGQCI